MSATILIVDDSNLSRRILRSILEPAGYQVIEASSGFMALERYTLDHPDLVILDLTMREMHGIDVLHKLRELDAHARVIIGSADVQRSTQALVAAAGARRFVPKPFDATTVLNAVAEVLGGAL